MGSSGEPSLELIFMAVAGEGEKIMVEGRTNRE